MKKPLLELTRQLMRADAPAAADIVATVHGDQTGKLTHVTLHAKGPDGKLKNLLISIDVAAPGRPALNYDGVF